MIRSLCALLLFGAAATAYAGGPAIYPHEAVIHVGDTIVLMASNEPGGLSTGFPYNWSFTSDNSSVADIHGFAKGSGYLQPDPLPNNGDIFVKGIGPGVAHVGIAGFTAAYATITVETPPLPVQVDPPAVTVDRGLMVILTASVPDRLVVLFTWYLGRLGDTSHFLQSSNDPTLRFVPTSPLTTPTTYVWVQAASTDAISTAEVSIHLTQPRRRLAHH